LFINYHFIIVLLKQSPAAQRVYLPAGQRASTRIAQRAEWTAGQLSRFHHKRPMASKFAEYKPNGLSHVGCYVESLLQTLNKVENSCRSQGTASGYLGQPDTKTDRQGCERLIKVCD